MRHETTRVNLVKKTVELTECVGLLEEKKGRNFVEKLVTNLGSESW